jgi:hypothetical protein
MRAILIDPEKRTITEIPFEGDYRTIQTILAAMFLRRVRARSTAHSQRTSTRFTSAMTISKIVGVTP